MQQSAMQRLGRCTIVATLIVAMAVGLSACGGGDAPPPPSEGSATIDAAGGEVAGPDGVKLAVPAGALGTATTVRIARDGSGAPELGGAKLISPVYAITPHGTAFAESARISIPFQPADVAPGTQPVLMRAQPGGGWEALVTDVDGGTVSAADTPGLSFYAVGTCWTSRDAGISGPDPLLYCPGAHTLQLTVRDGNGALLPVLRNGSGVAQPVMTITAPTNLSYTLSWTRPAGTQRSDRVWMQISDAGLLPAQQPLSDFAVSNDFTRTFTTTIDPESVPGAGAAGGRVIRLRASAVYTTDAFYPGCVCFQPASWNFTTEIPVRVVYSGVQPVITQQPASVSVVEGQPASFTVGATGSNLSVVWTRGRGNQPNDLPNFVSPMPNGSHTFTLPVTSAANHDGWAYGAQVCSNRGVAGQERCVLSNAAPLNVTPFVVAPVFTTQPASITVLAGQTASLTAVASGQPAPTIEWSRLVGSPFSTLQPICSVSTGTGGRTSASCTTPPLTLADNGMRIQAFASNGPNSINVVGSAAATITVLPQALAPSITSPAEPADRTVQEGGSVTWTVGAAGTAPLSYAWRTVSPVAAVNDGGACDRSVPAASRNAATLALSNVPLACNGYSFQLVVSNGTAPNALSRLGLLTVTPASAAPTITSGLADRSVVEGTQVSFSVSATGAPASFAYVWTLGGAAIPNVVSGCGTGSATCTFTAQLPDSGRTIAVRVANGIAPDATSSATLTVTSTDVPASITAQPLTQNVLAGNSATFTVGIAGTPTPGVQWETSSDGISWIAAGTGATLTIANTTAAQNGLRVRAVVSNTTRIPSGTQVNSVTSNEATLAVGSNLPPNALLATQVTTVANRTLAVHPNGTVYAWGAWVDPLTGGYTPNGTWAQQPVRVQGLGPMRQVAIGSDYASWALAADGTVWGWGYLNSTQPFAQGPGNTNTSFPAPVQLLESANTPIDRVCQIEGTTYGVVMVRSEVVGGTCAADERRSVWYTANISGRESTSSSYAVRYSPLDSGGALLPMVRWIKEIVTSRNHGGNQSSVFAIANDGTVYAWGYLNAQGQLGLGSNSTQPATPQPAPGWQGALKIAAAGEVTLALMADGSIKGAGWNPSASLGIGPVSFTAVTTPTTLSGIAGAGDVSTASNNSGSMALVGGQLRYWGSNTQLNAATQVAPIAIAAPATPLTSVAVGGRHAVAIGPGNAVYSWGDPNYRGCALSSSTCNASTPLPALVTMP
jgi:alpha-tubulin suppressor-like RCC1 family protein